MTDMPIAGNAPETGNTVWREKVSLLDQIPKPVAIVALGLFLVAIWQLVTAAGVVSRIGSATAITAARRPSMAA